MGEIMKQRAAEDRKKIRMCVRQEVGGQQTRFAVVMDILIIWWQQKNFYVRSME